MCSHPLLTPENKHYLTCQDCGCVVKTVYHPSDMQLYEDYTKAPLVMPYKRSTRFKKMLDSICMGCEQPNDTKMFKHLLTQNCHSRGDIINGMSSSSLVDKRFCSLHVFMKCFCPDELKPCSASVDRFHKTKRFIYKTFDDIDFQLSKHIGRRFLNYRFVIDILLSLYEFDLWRCFVKPLKCPKRILKCVTLFNSLNITVHDKAVVIPDSYSMSPKSFFRPV
jgi:hypothetical protein